MASILKSLRLLADPTRLRLLLLLEQQELSVAEVQEILGMGQSRISSHLSQLKQAGLVRSRRVGQHVYYGLAPASEAPAHAQLKEVIRASAKEIPEFAHDKGALRHVFKNRQDKTREYFNRLAGKFGRRYCPGRTWKGVAQMLLSLVGPIVVADLGAGEGTLSQMLARRAKRVIAVDSSEKMVEFGEGQAKRHGFGNVEYRAGDIEDPPIEPGTVDLALLSQALHHASDPARAIAAAYRILKRGGRIAVLDLLAHNFEQARKLYADLWLGFGESDLHRMLEEAGFKKIEVAVVARESKSPNFQTIFATGLKP